MEKTIVILLILLVIYSLVGIFRVSKISTKEKAIEFYSKKIEEAKNDDSSDSVVAFASLAVFVIYIAIIYFSIQSILSFIK